MIAPAGFGKTAADNEVARLFLSNDFLSVPSIDSGPALVDTFVDVNKKYATDYALGFDWPCTARVLLNPDEMDGLFKKSKVTKEGRNTIFSEVLTLFEGNIIGNRSRQHGAVTVENAHLAIIGGAPPKVYEQMWLDTGGSASGLQSRFTLVTTNTMMPDVRKPESGENDTHPHLQALRSQILKPPTMLCMHPESIKMLDEWGKSAREKSAEQCTRVSDLVKRFLMVLAVTNGTDMIDPWLMEVGLQFGTYQIALRERFNPDDAAGWVQAFENRIIKAYRTHGPMTDNQLRRIVSPEKSKGGFGPYLQAIKNLRAVGMVVHMGSTERAEIWGLAEGGKGLTG